MEVNTSQILKGMLEACLLKIISKKDMYGYEITENLASYGLDIVAQGTIYPLLLKLEKEKLLTSYTKENLNAPPRKYYKITDDGIEYIKKFNKIWISLSSSINNIMK